MTNTSWTSELPNYAGPKYLALSRALRDAIRGGRLTPGTQLPTVRDLAWELKVTPGTVARAYQLATSEGLLSATVGRGTFVATASPQMGPTQSLTFDRDPAIIPGKANMRAPRLPDVGQAEVFARAYAGLLPRMREDWLDYPMQQSEAPLRQAVVRWLEGRILGPVDAGDIALTLGGQNAIQVVMSCVLRGERPVVLIEDLAYPGFRHAARLARAEVIGIETDQHGLRPDALQAALLTVPAQLLCLTPEAQNPTTVHMPLARRSEIATIARAHDIQIIDDNCYAPGDQGSASFRAIAPERTWYVGSLSKTVSAALRFGWIVCPEGMGRAGRLTAQHSYYALPRPVSDLCLALFTTGEVERILAAVSAVYADQLQGVVNQLGAHQLSWQPGLPFVWLELPAGWRASTFTRMAEAEGVLCRSADEFALIGGRAPHAVRLALNGQLTRAETEAACAKLADLLMRPPGELSA